ncbi:hypothetical protein L1049_024126 [Liquidambar formosana]|uniref:Uncharacterized protein n=1 Tax=Liquidambar formosana TaxID=63359 RepID=A0AAP0S102_LIQFO
MATECNKEFSISYMVLNADEVSLLDLFRFLFSHDAKKRKFLEVPVGTEENFKRSWMIFVSVLAQKFLLFVANPLSWFGSVVEHWLNLMSSNRNFGWLLLNFLRGGNGVVYSQFSLEREK